MKIPHPYKCDAEGCTNQKGEANHWLLQMADPEWPGGFRMIHWQQELADSTNCKAHICGRECAGKMLSKWLSREKA